MSAKNLVITIATATAIVGAGTYYNKKQLDAAKENLANTQQKAPVEQVQHADVTPVNLQPDQKAEPVEVAKATPVNPRLTPDESAQLAELAQKNLRAAELLQAEAKTAQREAEVAKSEAAAIKAEYTKLIQESEKAQLKAKQRIAMADRKIAQADRIMAANENELDANDLTRINLARLEKDFNALHKEHTTLLIDHKQHCKALELANASLKKQRGEIAFYRAKNIPKLERDYDLLCAEMEKLKLTHAELAADYNALVDRRQHPPRKLTRELELLKKENAAYCASIEKLKKDNKLLAIRLQAAGNNNHAQATLQRSYDALVRSNEAMKKELHKAKGQIATLRKGSNATALHQEITLLKRDVAKHCAVIDSLEAENKAMVKQIDTLKRAGNHKRRVAELTRSLQLKSAELNASKKKQKDTSIQLLKAQKSLREALAKGGDAAIAQAEINKLREELQASQTSHKKSKATVADLKDRLLAQGRHLAKVNDENEKLREKVRKLED